MKEMDCGGGLTGPNLSRQLRSNSLSLRERARVRGGNKDFLPLGSLILTFSRREKEPRDSR